MTTTRFAATDEYAVRITTHLRTFPYRKTDYVVAVVDQAGSVLAQSVVGSESGARKIANIAWVALRAGVVPRLVWN